MVSLISFPCKTKLEYNILQVCDDAGPSFLSAYADLLFTTIARSFSEPVDNLMTGNFGRRPADIVEEATVNRLVVCIDAYSRSNCLPRYKLKQLLGYIFCKCCDILKTLSAKSPRLHDTRPEHQSFGGEFLVLRRYFFPGIWYPDLPLAQLIHSRIYLIKVSSAMSSTWCCSACRNCWGIGNEFYRRHFGPRWHQSLFFSWQISVYSCWGRCTMQNAARAFKSDSRRKMVHLCTVSSSMTCSQWWTWPDNSQVRHQKSSSILQSPASSRISLTQIV